jgi:hypothetical protein
LASGPSCLWCVKIYLLIRLPTSKKRKNRKRAGEFVAHPSTPLGSYSSPLYSSSTLYARNYIVLEIFRVFPHSFISARKHWSRSLHRRWSLYLYSQKGITQQGEHERSSFNTARPLLLWLWIQFLVERAALLLQIHRQMITKTNTQL